PCAPDPGARQSRCWNIWDQKKQGEHGRVFTYKSVNTDVLAWITRRITGETLAAQLSSESGSQWARRRTPITPSTVSASMVVAVLTGLGAISFGLVRSCAIAVTSTAARSYLLASSTTSRRAAIRKNSPLPATPHCRAGPTTISGG